MDYDKLIERLNTKLQSYAAYTDSEFAHVMEDAIAAIETLRADLAQVRHGRWEQHPQSSKNEPVYTCSLCKLNVSDFEKRWLKYCPNCGAKMDGKEIPTCHDGVCEIPGVEREEDDHD